MDRMEQRAEAHPSTISVEHETMSSATRTTAGNRSITYRMRVLQQPVRARACGQGAKSSADRRPVDPPPIVELKMFEGENDITFSMNANYFLFATLEHARPMAHGRVTGERASPPVLTGTPVAGITYLDRPSPAGYFIFPDLSVRHEGIYRLSFSLYEEPKDPSDDDKSEDSSALRSGGEFYITHRLEVKSEPFTVFSAKKFPGLTESTHLSRTVAEQGCRVRIRRDVRLRRSAAKATGKDWEDYEEETAQARARMSHTPDPNVHSNLPVLHGYVDPMARPRSPSIASHQSYPSLSRRPSLQEMNQTFNQPHYNKAPHTPQNGFTQANSYGPSPSQQYQPQFVQQPTAMQPPPLQYQPQSYPPPSSTTAPTAQHGYFNYPPPPSQTPPSQYSMSGPHAANMAESFPPYPQSDHRRATLPTGYGHTAYSGMAPQQYQPPSMLRPAPLEPRAHSIAAPIPNRQAIELPPLNTTLSNTKLEAASPGSALPPNSFHSTMQTPVESHKRSFSNVFNDPYQNQPLRHGARPETSYGEAPQISAAEDDDTAHADFAADAYPKMQYRRADGREIRRALPPRA